MNAVRLAPVWLAFWLMAAHAWRAGWTPLAVALLAAPALAARYAPRDSAS